jgi:hypothetical protein
MKNKKQIKMLVKALKSHQEYSKKHSWADSWAEKSDGQELLLTINQIMPALAQSIDQNTRVVTTNRVISSADLLSSLIGQIDFGWHDYNNGRELSTKMMANLLQPFGLKPAKHRTSSTATVRGYLLTDLERAIKQYIPPSAIAAVNEKATPQPTPTPIRWRRSVVHEKILDLFDQSMCAYEQAKLLNVTDPKTAESLRAKAAQLQARAITAMNKNFTHLVRPDVD